MAVQRNLRFAYGSFVTGATNFAGVSARTLLHEIHTFRLGPEDFEVGFTFVLDAPTEAAFGAAVAQVETDLRVPREALIIDVLNDAGAFVVNLLTKQDSDDSGFNVQADFEKPGSEFDSNLSRLYSVTVVGGLPSLLAGGQRIDLEFDIDFTSSRVTTITARGSYTATTAPAATARANYLANVDARIAALTTSLGIITELVTERFTEDEQNQLVVFERVVREIIHDQAIGVLDNLAIVNPALVVRRTKFGSVGSRDDRQLAELEVTYQTAVDQEQTKNLEGLWLGTIRPWILQNVTDALPGGSPAIVRENVEFDPEENILSASLTLQAPTGSKTLVRSVRTTDRIQFGWIPRLVWPQTIPPDNELGGLSPTPGYAFRGGKTVIRTVTTTTTRLGRLDTQSPVQGGGRAGGQIPVGIGVPRQLLGLGADALGIFAIGAELNLEFVSPEAAAGQGADGGRSGGPAGQPGQVEALLLEKTQDVQNRAIGLPEAQLDVHDVIVTETLQFLAGVTQAAGAGSGGITSMARQAR